jgi:tetratricopeptide (TPR) repeat protein
MSPERWQRIQELFDAANRLPPGERSHFLGERCGDDHALRQELERMLSSEDSGVIHEIVQEAAASVEIRDEWKGRRVGPYRIIDTIGHGGMGAVYRAARDDQSFDKQVAVKFLAVGTETPEALLRFRQERQILANLEHPNIARLIDGGDTEDGRPYIVLEYVQGEPITTYCRRRNLPPRARLDLFLRVCAAVEYAHRSLVIHRDLKPGNILVTGDGEPKLLDFGIAKLLNPAGDGTATMFQAMTPQYASPEQVTGGAVSTVTDVYALGVILYELMTGRYPYKIETSAPSEILRTVCHTEPGPPGLKNEIDHVILMAIRKEPERRYPSVESLSQDIRRYLEHYPVAARPDTIWYQARKYARRHRLALAVAATLVVSLGLGVLAERRQAQIARERFDLVRGLANRFVFDVYDSLVNVPAATEARRKVVETAKEYLDRLSLRAGQDAGFLADLSVAYDRLANVEGSMASEGSQLHQEEAGRDFDRSLALIRKAASLDPARRPALLFELWTVSNFQRNRRNLSRATAVSDEAIALGTALAAAKDLTPDLLDKLAGVHLNAARVYEDSGEPDKMRDELEKSLSLYELLDTQRPTAASKHRLELTLSDLADFYQGRGDTDQALALMSRALEYGVMCAKMEPQNRLYARSGARTRGEIAHLNYDVEAPSLRELDRSLTVWEQTIRELESLAQTDPQDKLAQLTLAINLTESAITLAERSPKSAEAAARRGVSIFDGLRAANPKFDQSWGAVWGRARTRLAWILTRTGQSAEARSITEATLPVLRDQYRAAPGQLSSTRALAWGLQVSARVHSANGDSDRADANYREALDLLAPGLAKKPPDVNYWSCTALAHDAGMEVHRRAGNRARVREIAGQVVALWDAWPGSTHWIEGQRQKARERLAGLGQ